MKSLPYVNLFGVLLLAGLCVVQWQRDRRLNLEVNRLEKVRFEAESKLQEQQQTLRQLEADLAHFKDRFVALGKELNESNGQLRDTQRELTRMTAERDQLKTNLDSWISAVAARDQRLEDAQAQLERLTDQLNASVNRFNTLATNHNAVVKDLNELRARVKPQP